MSNVADYSDERARRGVTELPELDEGLAAGVGDEMAAALAAASPLAKTDEEKAFEFAGRMLLDDEIRPAAVSPLEAQWLRFRDQFEEAMGGGLYTVENLERRILEGDAYFWPGKDCALIAERVVYPSGESVLQTLWAVGDLDEVLTLEPALASTARLLGCSRILIEGRKGWERLMKPAGYEPFSITLQKVL